MCVCVYVIIDKKNIYIYIFIWQVCSNKQKAIWLSAFAVLAKENQTLILEHNYHLGPIVYQYVLAEAMFFKENPKKNVSFFTTF